ncbi:L-2,4-diaminobutyrate decarboxylase [Pseudomonas sp. ADAK2 TE3594]
MNNAWTQHFLHTGPRGAEAYRETINQCTHEIATMIEAASRPYSGMELNALKEQISCQSLASDDIIPMDQAIKEVSELIAANAIIVQHPHCIAHLHTPPFIAGVAAENFISAQNLSMDSWDQSGAATYVEQRVVRELCDIYGFVGSSNGVFTSGGTQSNIMALLIARDRFIFERSGHNVQLDGLPDYAGRLRIIASDKSHVTVDKAATIMGLGQRSVVRVPTHPDGSIIVAALEQTLTRLKSEGLLPFAIVGTAGTTDHGAVDDLYALARIARQENIWLHVDAAYGSALIFSHARDRLAGIDLAHSIALDFHKMWFQPISCGALLMGDRKHFKHLLHRADYLNREDDELPNLVDFTVSTTRRFDALKVFLSLRTVGTQTLGAMVDHLLLQAQEVSLLIAQRPDFELLATPALSTVLFRYTGGFSDDALDRINKALRLALLKTGTAVVGETVIEGKTALKLTLLNPCLTMENFKQLVSDIERCAINLHQPDLE